MDDIPIDFTPEKTRNTKKIILIVAVAAILSLAVYTSYNTKYVDESANDLHATVIKDITLIDGRLDGEILNDGEKTWDISSINIIGGKISCFRLPTDIKTNETASLGGMYCTATDTDKGASYSVLIYVNDSEDETKKYLISGTVQM